MNLKLIWLMNVRNHTKCLISPGDSSLNETGPSLNHELSALRSDFLLAIFHFDWPRKKATTSPQTKVFFLGFHKKILWLRVPFSWTNWSGNLALSFGTDRLRELEHSKLAFQQSIIFGTHSYQWNQYEPFIKPNWITWLDLDSLNYDFLEGSI